MVKLGVNLDHVATIRQQRYTPYPDMLTAIKISEESGADSITMHLREDRRHIQFEDIKIARKNINTKLNLEMAPTNEMCRIANQVKPDFICLVPEKRQELTTEGGLDIKKNFNSLKSVVSELQESKALISLFIEPDLILLN
jgi:pyridoxine 5-phosphate synthase